ncbi:hypothetical protein [Mucilaginibacter sp. L196]|uniref:hypothetical protein n=1 Tax=Mucilaginibacter sp. L196 TaxID=1641870 RepID=UPI00131EA403|nr:hypothetical protein [Mucilaginibacter sp. L196]
MIDNTLHFLRTQLSVGNAWQNIAMYSVLALLVKLVTMQHSLLKTRHKPATPATGNDDQEVLAQNQVPRS